MEQKFVNFDEVVEKLGITSERLHSLREEGQLRAYRDGKSWKFRTDEIAGMVESGVPDAPPPSDIGLVSPADLVEAAPIDLDDDDIGLSLVSEDDLELASPDSDATSGGEGASVNIDAEKSDPNMELGLDDTDPVPGDSALELAGLDETVTADGSDIELDLELPEAGPSDSILLSEATLGESVSGSPSTIIGKDKLGSVDDDLELALDDDDHVTSEGSDVKLSPATGASDVLSSGVAGSGVLDDLENATGGTSAFKDLEELEIDLSAESSRILSPEDVAEAKSASKPASEDKLAAASDLELADLELADDDSPAEVSPAEPAKSSDSGFDLAGDSDLVLADAGGSDLTLESGDSGINLISPSDSGLALDDIPLEMGGSAILSSLSLEGSDPEISLFGAAAGAVAGAAAGAASGSGDEPMAELQTDDDFQLTPLSEGADVEEGDSSSQVIALDADIEDFSDGAEALEESDFAEEEGEVFSEDFAEAPAGDLDMGYAPVPAAAAVVGTPYSMLNIVGLGCSTVLLMLAGTMMLDMMRNIWSWNETYTLNSSLMDAILGWF